MAFYRKIVVDSKTYEYKVGKLYTKIRNEDGVSTLVHHTEMIGCTDAQLDDYKFQAVVTPADIAKYIGENPC